MHASPSNGDAEASGRVAALRQDLAAARDAEVSVMWSLQSELRRLAWTTVHCTLSVHSAMSRAVAAQFSCVQATLPVVICDHASEDCCSTIILMLSLANIHTLHLAT